MCYHYYLRSLSVYVRSDDEIAMFEGGKGMSRKTVVEAGAIILTLGILASPAGAEPVKLADAQMDNIYAGAFGLSAFSSTNAVMTGLLGTADVTLTSTNNGMTYTSSTDDTITTDDIVWTTQALYISTTQGFAVGVLSNPQGQYWDGQRNSAVPMTAVTQSRGLLIGTPIG
jgi:hypothetical protein